MAIIRKLISFAVSVQKKKGSGSKSKSDWVSFSDAKVLHFNLADAHVCSCLLILSERNERGSCLVITEWGIQMGTEWGSQLVTDCGIQLGTE